MMAQDGMTESEVYRAVSQGVRDAQATLPEDLREDPEVLNGITMALHARLLAYKEFVKP